MLHLQLVVSKWPKKSVNAAMSHINLSNYKMFRPDLSIHQFIS